MYNLFYAASAANANTSAHHASREASDAAHKATVVQDEVRFVRADVEKLLMVTEALWMILKEQHGYTDDQLLARVQEIDLRDGRLDGKVAKGPARKCPACERSLIGDRPVCLYCGHRVERGVFER